MGVVTHTNPTRVHMHTKSQMCMCTHTHSLPYTLHISCLHIAPYTSHITHFMFTLHLKIQNKRFCAYVYKRTCQPIQHYSESDFNVMCKEVIQEYKMKEIVSI